MFTAKETYLTKGTHVSKTHAVNCDKSLKYFRPVITSVLLCINDDHWLILGDLIRTVYTSVSTGMFERVFMIIPAHVSQAMMSTAVFKI